jgi:hypothetical protein
MKGKKKGFLVQSSEWEPENIYKRDSKYSPHGKKANGWSEFR